MASVSMAEARAYLGIDGNDHDVYLAGMRNLAERYVRGLTSVGSEQDSSGNYTQPFPDDLQLAQLLMVKFYFDRRENAADAKSPPGLFGYIGGYGADGDAAAAAAAAGVSRTLYDAHVQNENAHHTPPLTAGPAQQSTVVGVSNVELKDLDMTYLAVAPAPGPGKYLQLTHLWIKKMGDDAPLTFTEIYRLAVGAGPVITEAEALAGESMPLEFQYMDIPDWQTPHYLYAGVDVTGRDIRAMTFLDFTDWERVPGTVEVDGVAIKWWRTSASYATRGHYTSRTQTRVRLDHAVGSVEQIIASAFFGVMFITDLVAVPPLVYGVGHFDSAYSVKLQSLLLQADGTFVASALGGQSLTENAGLSLGVFTVRAGPDWFTEAAYDQYIAEVDDVSLNIQLRYQIHDVPNF